MWQRAHDSYLESRILSADPIELIRMLYDAATGAVRDARSHMAAKDIRARARSISKASAIVIELGVSLDHERGGKISIDLGRLYDYILRKLTEANLQQSDALLGEVLGLLTTLSEGWEGVKGQTVTPQARREEAPAVAVKADVKSESSWSQPAAAETASSYGNSWSQPAPAEPATSYGSSWSQPVAAEPATSYSSAWSQPVATEPASSYGNSWSQSVAAEPATSYTNSWAESQAKELASLAWHTATEDRPAAHESAWSPSATQEQSAPQASPWETTSPESASSYGASWVPSEPAAAHSSHDWSF